MAAQAATESTAVEDVPQRAALSSQPASADGRVAAEAQAADEWQAALELQAALALETELAPNTAGVVDDAAVVSANGPAPEPMAVDQEAARPLTVANPARAAAPTVEPATPAANTSVSPVASTSILPAASASSTSVAPAALPLLATMPAATPAATPESRPHVRPARRRSLATPASAARAPAPPLPAVPQPVGEPVAGAPSLQQASSLSPLQYAICLRLHTQGVRVAVVRRCCASLLRGAATRRCYAPMPHPAESMPPAQARAEQEQREHVFSHPLLSLCGLLLAPALSTEQVRALLARLCDRRHRCCRCCQPPLRTSSKHAHATAAMHSAGQLLSSSAEQSCGSVCARACGGH